MMMGAAVNRLESSVFFKTDEPEVIDTRFGKIALQKSNPITFPRGLLGMPDKFHFFLTEFPNEKLHKFKLMQCLDDYNLSFITLPLTLQNDIVMAEDLTQGCKELGMNVESLVTLLIVSVQRTPGKTQVSVNARAPLLIDTSSRLAAQYVFTTDRYLVQQPISV
jgi:flagellar assembly factor FliW